MDASRVQREPERDGGHGIGPAPIDAGAVEREEEGDRYRAGEQPGRLEGVGVEDGKRQHREDVVDHGESCDEHPEPDGNALPQQGENAEREGDVGGGRNRPARGMAARAAVHQAEDDRGQRHRVADAAEAGGADEMA